jgi:hypothetical protein
MLWNRDLSLFSPQALQQIHHRGLLLQFVIAELLESHRMYRMGFDWELVLSSHPRFFPYDWAARSGHLNKAQEHALLLEKSFPVQARTVKKFETLLSKILFSWSKKEKIAGTEFSEGLQSLFSCLEPLMAHCKEDENLIFFLLKNRIAIDELMQQGYLRQFLLKMNPSGLETLGEKMCDQYHQRGFAAQISELKHLMAELVSHP